jgi:hypothetical protein
MEQTIFNELKDEFDIELHETLKNYCDAIWCTNRETDVGDFEKTIVNFFELSKKAELMYFENRLILWFFKNDPIYSCIKKTLKITSWDNTLKENGIYHVLNKNEVYKFDNQNNEFEIYILEFPEIFRRVFLHIFYNHYNE